MFIEKLEESCEFAFAALDGMYGWMSEALAIAIVVVVFNFLAKRILKRLHQRFEKQKNLWKDSFVTALYLPLSYFVWFFAAIQALDLIATRILKEPLLTNRHLILAVGAALTFSWFLMRWKRNVVQHLIAKSKKREIAIDQGKIGAIDKLATVLIAFFTILIILEVTDHSMTTLIALGGVGGLAIAFASQEIIANFFGGFMIYLTQPFTIGDWIQIPDHSIEGHVEEIGWYMTRVRSLDKQPIYIPNSIFTKLIVITPSRMSHRQIKDVLGISYNDLPKIKALTQDLKEMLQQHPDLDHSLPIIVRWTEFGQHSLDILINVFTPTTGSEDYLKIKEDILFKIASILEKNDVEMATPSQHITLLNSKGL